MYLSMPKVLIQLIVVYDYVNAVKFSFMEQKFSFSMQLSSSCSFPFIPLK